MVSARVGWVIYFVKSFDIISWGIGGSEGGRESTFVVLWKKSGSVV